MVAVDTNIVVRLLVNDDPEQSGKAAGLFRADKIFIAKTVMLETEWILRGVYDLDRKVVNNALRKLLSLGQVVAEDEAGLLKALDAHLQGMDFADAVHLVSSHRAKEFATFDAKFKAVAKKLSLKPPVVFCHKTTSLFSA